MSAPIAPAGASAAPPTGRLRRLLIIDDSPIDLLLYQRIIKRSGLIDEIVAFDGADHALNWLEGAVECPVDAILLDVNMPRMNGFEFLTQVSERLAERFSACVVIMLTTSLAKEDVERARSFEKVRAYVNKPLTVAVLERVVGLVERSRALGHGPDEPAIVPLNLSIER